MDAMYAMMVRERIDIRGESMREAISAVDILLLPPEESRGRQNLAGVQGLGLKIVGMPEAVGE